MYVYSNYISRPHEVSLWGLSSSGSKARAARRADLWSRAIGDVGENATPYLHDYIINTY